MLKTKEDSHINATDEPKSLIEEAYRNIKNLIFQQKLIPGQRLVYDDLGRMLNMSRTPIINALNKIDRFAHPEQLAELLDDLPNSLPISALAGRGITGLLDRIEEELEADMTSLAVTIPYQRGDLVDLFHKRGLVEQETHNGQGTHIVGKLPAEIAMRFEKFG